jgi:hypothetical protein
MLADGRWDLTWCLKGYKPNVYVQHMHKQFLILKIDIFDLTSIQFYCDCVVLRAHSLTKMDLADTKSKNINPCI